jgi:hypothetical protein
MFSNFTLVCSCDLLHIALCIAVMCGEAGSAAVWECDKWCCDVGDVGVGGVV